MLIIGNKRKKAQATKKLRRQWCTCEKLMILQYSQRFSKRKAARMFVIETKQIMYWANQKEELMALASYTQKLHPGRSAALPELEKSLFEWVQSLREASNTVTRNMVIKKAKKLATTAEMKQIYTTINNFKFSNKWLDGFINRYNLSNRRRTTISQKISEDLIEKQHLFLSFVLYCRIQYDYPLHLIGNMNETPLSFDLPSSTTLE
jgi:hypothetical protein